MRPTALLLARPVKSKPKPPKVTLSTPRIYTSNSLSPWYNLSYEDWLFRNTPVEVPILFLYRNEHCVVIGRNQNPWLETSPRLLASRGWPLVRRRSGGGAVFHDPGNSNFCMLLPRLTFHRPTQTTMVRQAVQKLGERRARENGRFDVFVDEFKISGSAFKIIAERAYHHGTMLLSTNSELVREALTSQFDKRMITESILSKTSPVMNLVELAGWEPEKDGEALEEEPAIKAGTEVESMLPEVADPTERFTHERFITAMTDVWEERFGPGEKIAVTEEEMREIAMVQKGAEELSSWDWVYGQTPYFTLRGKLPQPDLTEKVEYKVYHGVIKDIGFPALQEPSQDAKRLARALVDSTATFQEAMGELPPSATTAKQDDPA
ncbi:hypothetical protein DACRYDRAFT_73717 [Dacryopinax primogenitus]|uniref:Putative lipoate-protein ligase A n=1 Tax=Dacryopinax primogenitus (strain DJM 731) TaxID=1858805 RepID=M5GCN2_DACPD|nr:uncharacterized protein DACRYDRAFT_73717 [Dacryopinax primogenitus]EJU06315.1 hypothetical protein DACRYDRAFT_73717 [Dacryopinax primogenitus]